MSNYLNQLVAKSFNLTDTVQPLLLSMFEPIPESAGMVGVADSNWEQQTVTGEKNQLETEWDTWISTVFAIEEPSESQLPSTLDSGESPVTPTPEELSYQESPDLTPASASDFEELQSTDLTPASALNSEELLKLAPQLPEQVNSEPSPNETLSQPVVIEHATEQVLSNLDRQKLTPAVEVQTNLSQATPPVEQNPQPAHKSSWNPPTIINRVVSTTPQQLVEPNSHIIPPPPDVETLLGVESKLVTSTQRDDDRWQESANQLLPPRAVISPVTQNVLSTSKSLPLTKAIATETFIPPVSPAAVPQQLPKPESHSLIESHRVVSRTPSQQVFTPNSHIIPPPPDVETLLGVESQHVTSRQRDDHSWQQSANQPLPPRAVISPVTHNPQSSSTTQPFTKAIATQTIVPLVSPAPVPQQLRKSESDSLIETHRVVSTTPSQQVVEPNSHIIPPPPDVETLLGEETLQIMSKPGDDHRRQQLANPLLPQSAFISPITQNIHSTLLTQPKTRAIATETIVPPVSLEAILQQQSKPHSEKLIESHRLVSKTPSQQVQSPNSHIIPPPPAVETLLGEETLQIMSKLGDDHRRQQLANPLLPQSAFISPITQNLQSSSLTQPKTRAIATETIVPPVVPQQQSKPESEKLIESHRLVSKTPSQQVLAPNSYLIHPSGDVESLLGEETLQITSRQRDEHRQQLANAPLPQSAFISPITQNLQSSSLTQPKTRAIATETIVPLANSNIKPPHLPTPESSLNGFIEINPVASFPQLPEAVSSNSRRLSPLLQDVENLQVTSQKVLPNQDRQPLTPANVQQTNVLLASLLTEPQQKQNNESFNNQPIKIHRVASSSQLQEMEKKHLNIIPPSLQNVKTLHVTSLQDGDMTSQLSLNQPQLLSGEILPAHKVLSTPDRQPLTPANAWETNVPLATPAAVPRQQPATKFLENSPVQINIAPEKNTALSNSVPEPQLQSAPELSGIQQHVVNRVVSSPQLPIVAPLPQQSFLETNDTPRRNLPEGIHTVSTLNTPRGRQRDFSQELNGFEQIVPNETIGLADGFANTATGMIHPLTTAPVVQPLENSASSELPNSRIQESRTTDEELSPSQYTKVIQQSLEKTIHWNDVAGQESYSAVETSSQRLEHLMGLYLQEKFRNLPTPPNIKISIGRVEIRATQPPTPARPKPRPMPSSVMSLDEYLSRRAKGGRR